MRQFGTDKPEFLSFTLGKSKTIHKLPLGTSLPFEYALRFAEIAAMEDEEKQGLASLQFQKELLDRYIGEAAKDLTTAQVQEIFEAWSEEGSKTGVTQGE